MQAPSMIAALPLDLTATATCTAGFVAGNGGTTADARAALIAGLGVGTAYFNVHSQTFPGGEIRGFLAPVHEPSSYALMGLGLLAVGYLPNTVFSSSVLRAAGLVRMLFSSWPTM